MANPVIPREEVHRAAESCSDMGMEFQTIAARLLRSQSRLKTFMESNFSEIDPQTGQVALYMLAVSMRVFEEQGGRLKKINSSDLRTAQQKVNAAVDELLPLDENFPTRAKAVEWRQQPHLLDEILWALYEREDQQEEESPLNEQQSAMIYLMLWTAVEALNSKWKK